MSVDAYAAAGRDVEVPLGSCPTCATLMAPWSGYWRPVRHLVTCWRIFIPRNRCRPCRATHAVLPAFCLQRRLDSVEVIGAALDAVGSGSSGHRPAAVEAAVPRTTARGWVRAFGRNAERLAVAFAALCVELASAVPTLAGNPSGRALAALSAATEAAVELPGWAAVGRWRFSSAVTGGTLLCRNTISPYLFVGGRRLMPPVP
jgi:hypothetical protein